MKSGALSRRRRIPLASGGHHLKVRTTAAVFIRELEVTAEPVAHDALLARLPFDMYQRYDQCRAVVPLLGGTRQSILDVGGALAGDGGHLAATGDFFTSQQPPLSIDVRHVDHPDHQRHADGRLPFPDASFDVVLCLDVLEHLAPADRETLQRELGRVARRFVLLARSVRDTRRRGSRCRVVRAHPGATRVHAYVPP